MNTFMEKWCLLMKENIDNENSNRIIKMNSSEIVIRQLLIINKLRKGDSSFLEISDYLQTESEIQSLRLYISLRTFQREMKSIATVFDIEITFDKSLKKYRINEDYSDGRKQRMLEALDVFNALNIKERLSENLLFENGNSPGTQYLYTILRAIKNEKLVRFNHKKFSSENSSLREIEPYALKEYKKRWYIVGLDTKKEEIRIFGLDRITNLTELPTKNKSKRINITEYFKNSFGVLTPNNDKAIDIKLTFTPYQAGYLKTISLHHSQKILNADSKKVVFSLHLVPTYDFVMELLSFGAELMYVEPKELRNKLLNHHKKGISALNN